MGTRYGTTINLDTFELLTDDTKILSQAMEVRLSTRPGTFFTDPLYGLPAEEQLGDAYDAGKGARIGARIAAEVAEDERILGATATLDKAGRFAVAVTPDDGAAFDLTGSIDDIRPALDRRDADEGV